MVTDKAAAEWRCPGFYLSLRPFFLFEFIHYPCAARCPICHIDRFFSSLLQISDA